MVKGVNKNIIEVNNTGSDIFEKIVFYITPKYASLENEYFDLATKEIEAVLENNAEHYETLRDRMKRKNTKTKYIVSLLIALGICLFVSGFYIFLK